MLGALAPEWAAGMLGLSLPQLVRLLKADDRDRVPKPRKGGADRFAMDEMRTFLARATMDVPVWRLPPSDMVELMKVNSLNRSWPETYRALRDGRLEITGRLIGREGLTSLLVRISDVRNAVFHDGGDAPTLSYLQTAARLRISGPTVTALRRATLLVYARRLTGDHVTQGPTLESVKSFESLYVSARELAGRCGRSVRMVMATLEEQRVARVVTGGKDVQAVYPRVAADAVLAGVLPDPA